MIVKEKHDLKPITQQSRRYKMYKDGKRIVTASIASLSVVGLLAVTSEVTAHADSNSNSAGTNQSTNGGNAVTATTGTTNTFNPAKTGTPVTSAQAAQSKVAAGTITQPVNIDHSQLNNAAEQARQAGLTVNQKPTTTQTVNADQVDSAKQNIKNDEAKQAQQIQTITRQHQMETSNVNNFNGSKGDTTNLDAKVKEAQSIPGLTVHQDQTQVVTKKASDTQGIRDAVNNATKSNNDQAQALQNAIDTQKRNNENYDKEKANYQHNLAEWKNSHKNLLNPNGISSSEIKQALELGREPDAVVSAPGLLPHTIGKDTKHGTDSKRRISFSKDGTPVTFTNLKHSFYYNSEGQKVNISKIVAKFYDIQANSENPDIDVYSDPTDGFWYRRINRVKVDYQFYAQDGKLINFDKNTAYLAFGSLNSGYYGADHARTEGINAFKGGEAVALLGSGIAKHGNYLYASDSLRGKLDYVNVNSDGSYTILNNISDSNWDNQGQYRYFGTGLDNISGNTIGVEYITTRDLNGTDKTDTWATMSTIIPATPGPQKPTPKYTQTSCHYNQVENH